MPGLNDAAQRFHELFTSLVADVLRLGARALVLCCASPERST